jgi:hypothetical protein
MVSAGRHRTNAPTKESVLSTLVHRAVSMPSQRPQAVRRGKRFFDGQVFEMADEIKSAASELEAAFSVPLEEVARDWSRARLLSDAGGPWFDACVDEFRAVAQSSSDRRWILKNLVSAIELLADFLQETAIEEGWRAIWSEAPLLIGPGTRRPTVKKPDQIVFLGTSICFLSDLKVTSDPYDNWRARKAKYAKHFRQCRGALESRQFDVVGCYLLLADASGKRRPSWERVDIA